MNVNFKRYPDAERAAAFAVGRNGACCDSAEFLNQALGGKFAPTPHGKVRNATAGVQDWSIGSLYPMTVEAVGVEPVQFRARDLHDDGAQFERRATYAEAERDAAGYRERLEKYGRGRTAQINRLQHTKGAVTWAGVGAPA